jgi:pimeloyl-ACP methyl ester carboxylesterase
LHESIPCLFVSLFPASASILVRASVAIASAERAEMARAMTMAANAAVLQPPPLMRSIGEVRALWDAVRVAARRRNLRPRRARGEAVIVIPGFLTTDLSTLALRDRLAAEGYAVYPWGLGMNRGPRDGTLRKLAQRIRALAREHGGPVHLVGWSMGGLLARVAAARTRAQVGRVITLGSPLNGDPRCSHLGALLGVACGLLRPARMRRLLRECETVEVVSIFSRNDGVVAWEASASGAGPIRAIEVDSTHLGMVVKPEVLDTVAAQLRRAPRTDARLAA